MGAVSGILYEKDFNAYKRLLATKKDTLTTKAVFKYWDNIVFTGVTWKESVGDDNDNEDNDDDGYEDLALAIERLDLDPNRDGEDEHGHSTPERAAEIPDIQGDQNRVAAVAMGSIIPDDQCRTRGRKATASAEAPAGALPEDATGDGQNSHPEIRAKAAGKKGAGKGKGRGRGKGKGKEVEVDGDDEWGIKLSYRI